MPDPTDTIDDLPPDETPPPDTIPDPDPQPASTVVERGGCEPGLLPPSLR